MLNSARLAAEALRNQLKSNGWLAGTFDEQWKSRAYYCCLTGLAQTAIIWSRLYQLDGNPDWYEASKTALTYLKKNHRRTGNLQPEDGGIAGSAPIWGRYSMFEFPNWATKFFADLILINGFNRVVPLVEHSDTQPAGVAKVSVGL